MSRTKLIRDIEEKIGERSLIWFGTRGSDASPLRVIEQFSGVFSMIAPLGIAAWADDAEACLEELSGVRLDLNAYKIDQDSSEAAAQLHSKMMDMILRGSVVAAYRSCHFLSAACYPAGARSELLSIFHGLQAAFDYKPWVESSLESQGVRVIPWRYFSDHDWHMLDERSQSKRYVLRPSYTDGGLGLRRLLPGEAVGAPPPRVLDRLIALAPDLEPNIPLNVGGCVFPDGTVTAHTPSLQLIGVPDCTSLPYGYCGNDFARVASVVSPAQLDELDEMVVRVGDWLHTHGYRGAFGIDALLYEDELYLTEVNPRFQGSSALSAETSADVGLTDIYLDHLASMLRLDAQRDGVPLREQARLQAEHPLSQLILYALGRPQRRRAGASVPDLGWGRVSGVPSSTSLTVEPNGMLLKLIIDSQVTDSGFDVRPTILAEARTLREKMFEDAPR